VKTYAEALTYLYSFINYEASAMTPRTDLRLSRMRRLLELAGNPHQRFRSILVAGTKGKGSTAVMLASIARSAGQRTGFLSTPHLNSHRERYRLDGRMIDEQAFVELMRRVRGVIKAYDGDLGPPTTYELGTLLAFWHFADANVDLAVVEVGLGGRLDATNVLETEMSVFAPISYDHVEVLGHTLTEIATEKAGIIKPGQPAVTAPQTPEAMAVLERVARQREAVLTVASSPAATGRPVCVTAGQDLPSPIAQYVLVPRRGPLAASVHEQEQGPGDLVALSLLGEHQLTNAGVATEAARQLGYDEDAICRGLETVRWPGRLEILREQPLVVADGAHNVDSMEKLAAAIRKHFAYDRLRLVAGFSADKDIAGIAPILNELADEIVLVQSKHARAAQPLAIARYFREPRLANSLDEALAGQQPREMALITGSLYLVGEARLQMGLVSPEDQDEL
jgi:dihydrofolate synthase / folylpolyglutamate synthase